MEAAPERADLAAGPEEGRDQAFLRGARGLVANHAHPGQPEGAASHARRGPCSCRPLAFLPAVFMSRFWGDDAFGLWLVWREDGHGDSTQQEKWFVCFFSTNLAVPEKGQVPTLTLAPGALARGLQCWVPPIAQV